MKDWTLFAIGAAMIVSQGFLVNKAEFNWIVLASGIGLTQAPLAMTMFGLLRTNGGSLQPPSDVQPLPPGSPSPSDSGASP